MVDNKDESLISHLEALRETLLKCFISLCIVIPFTLWLSPYALNFLVKVIAGSDKVSFNFFSPMEVFMLQLKAALLLDVIVCFPYMAKKIWDFILPALYDNEKKFIKTVAFASTFLFLLGACFCIFVIMPIVVKFGLSFAGENITPVFGLSNIINLTLVMAASFGAMFQMPLITIALVKSGVISYESLSDKRPYVIVIILILAAIFTPPDVISQLMLGTPTYLLFEAGLLLARKYKNQEKCMADENYQEVEQNNE